MPLLATDRVIPQHDTTLDGVIRWDPAKSLWYALHAAGAVAALAMATPGAIAVMLALTALTIAAGHSVGMHRLLIHRSFTSPLWLEHLLIYLGTLVGMAGPMGMIRAHDLRDWHQRQSHCPPHPSHGAGFWRDAWWQMHCRYALTNPPYLQIEPAVADDPVLRGLEATWRLQQLPLALFLYALGGWPWVLWGVSTRITLSLTGHFAIGHFAHRAGHQGWRIADLPVQGYNLARFGLITFGEAFHGNHHAFPHSARLGLEAGQHDPGYWLIQGLAALHLAHHIRLPGAEPPRTGLVRVGAMQGP